MVYTRFACHPRLAATVHCRRRAARRGAHRHPRRPARLHRRAGVGRRRFAGGALSPRPLAARRGRPHRRRAGRARPATAGSVTTTAAASSCRASSTRHVHSPQIDVIASYGTELLDWLTTHTFPAEARHADPAHAAGRRRRTSSTRCSRHGTTSAVVFPTVHAGSVDALFAAAEARGMRLITGKVLMDRNAPADLRRRRRHGRARLDRADRALARPRPARLCGDGALRTDQLARAARARRAAVPRRPDALHADARGREPRRGASG